VPRVKGFALLTEQRIELFDYYLNWPRLCGELYQSYGQPRKYAGSPLRYDTRLQKYSFAL